MSTHEKWYQDDTLLLGALQQGRRPNRGLPVIPGYDELRELSRGGQGIVFHALQRSTNRRVAIKVLLDGAWANETRRRRFEREIELIAALHHPNIVQLYDSGVTDIGYPYYVMEFIEGVSVDQLTGGDSWGQTTPFGPSAQDSAAGERETPPPEPDFAPILPLPKRLALFAKVCDAVHYAHQHGVIHRDLKPSNVRVDAEGEPHVLDFGLAKASGETGVLDASAVSHTGEFMGSLPWASPEQAEGNPHATDLRTDVYSLGVMLFQMLTGRFPYPVVGPFRQVLDHIQKTPPLRPSTLRREVDDELETINLKCLTKERDRRYQTAGEVARDVRHYLAGEPIEAKRDSALYTLRKTMRRYRTAARVSSAFVLLTLTGIVLMSFFWLRAKEAEQLADQRREAAEAAQVAQLQARTRADREAAQARAVSGFLVAMLAKPADLGREARVADVLDDAAAQLQHDKSLKPTIAAALRRALGDAYSSLGLYDEAEPLLESAVSLWMHELGPEDSYTLDGLKSVAWLHYQTGNGDQAETELRHILAVLRRTLGDTDLTTAQTMNDLAFILDAQGQFAEALDLHRTALITMRKLLGDEDLDTLTCMGNLAEALCSAGQLDESAVLMEERLTTARRVLGPDHRDTVRAMASYSKLLGQVGRYEESIDLTRQVYEADRRLLGEDHPEAIVGELNVGIGLSVLGRLEESEPYLRDALARARRVLGPQHPNALNALSALATVRNARGQYDEAEALYREALDTSAALRGAEHVDTLFIANSLGRCLQGQGKHTEAEALYRQIVASCTRSFGPENPYTLTALVNLGATLVNLRQFEEAGSILDQAIRIREQLFGADNIDTLSAKAQRGILLFERGDPAAALREFETLLSDTTRLMPAGHWYPALMRGWYGRCVQALERYGEAEEHLLASYEQLRATFGEQNPRTQTAIQHLVALYTAWPRPAEAGRWQELLAPNGPETQE